MYKNFSEEEEGEEEGEGEKRTVNYRLMTEEEIPSWFVEAVPILLYSPRPRWIIRSTGEEIECESRSTTATT